jgi:hypothetical protein
MKFQSKYLHYKRYFFLIINGKISTNGKKEEIDERSINFFHFTSINVRNVHEHEAIEYTLEEFDDILPIYYY